MQNIIEIYSTKAFKFYIIFTLILLVSWQKPYSAYFEISNVGKIWQRIILANLSYSPRLSSLILTDMAKLYLAYLLTIIFTNYFFVANSLHVSVTMVHQKFSPAKFSHVQ